MHFKSIFYLILLWSTSVFSQENIEVLSVLPSEISETSGLIFHNGKLITHNDSGNSAQLFEIDTTSYQITRTVTISNVENVDWEDLAQDGLYIYIGDFGNNVGIRRDLSIYRIPKADYYQSDTVEAEQINFSYEDQTDFANTGNSDWDAEAFFVLDDQLIILTKQWESNGTDAYSIPKTPGEYIAKKIDTYAINGLVTGATYNTLSDVLFLIGYSSTLGSFTASVEGTTANSIFEGTINRTSLSIGLAQVEAIAYSDIDTYFVSSEFFSRNVPSITLESQLFRFDVTEEVIEPEPEPEPNPEPEPEPDPNLQPELGANEIILYKGRLFDFLEYQSGIESPILRRSIFDPLGREIQFVSGSDIQDNRVDLSTLQNGIYYLTFYYSDSKKSIPFYKD